MNILLKLFPIIIVAIIFMVLTATQLHRSCTISAADSKLYALRLTGSQSKGVPIIVLTSDKCPPCTVLEERLKDVHVSYIRADVDRNEAALMLQSRVGAATPTVIVGTKVIVGSNIKEILKELAEQRVNRDFY